MLLYYSYPATTDQAAMSSQGRILVIEAEDALRQTLAEHLAAAGHGVQAGAGEAGLALLDGHDLVVVGEGAEALCARIKEGGGPPVLLLTTGPAVAEADAVVAKPFRLAALLGKAAELVARHRAGLAAGAGTIGPWRFDPAARLLADGDGRKVRLTDKEAAILALLRRAGGPVPRDMLLAEVWGYAEGVTSHTLETHIYRLRRKLQPDPAKASLLVTEEGGYRLA